VTGRACGSKTIDNAQTESTSPQQQRRRRMLNTSGGANWPQQFSLSSVAHNGF